ncbi:MAG: hypothetical protein ACI4XC_02365, partial [Eubacterium sp.]
RKGTLYLFSQIFGASKKIWSSLARAEATPKSEFELLSEISLEKTLECLTVSCFHLGLATCYEKVHCTFSPKFLVQAKKFGAAWQEPKPLQKVSLNY